jgi:hypothetical protein
MWLVFLQVLAAFGLGVFIVWWSLPGKRKRKRTSENKPDQPPG